MPNDTFTVLATTLKTLRSEIDKKDIPLIWVEFFLLVAATKDKGIRTQEVQKELGMTQGIASRMVKLMSTYMDPVSRTMQGYNVFTTLPDHEYRHQQRVYLSSKGKAIAAKVESIMSK